MVIAPPAPQSGMKSQTLPANEAATSRPVPPIQADGEHRPRSDRVEHAPGDDAGGCAQQVGGHEGGVGRAGGPALLLLNRPGDDPEAVEDEPVGADRDDAEQHRGPPGAPASRSTRACSMGHRSRLGAARVHAGETGSTHFGVARMRPLRHSCTPLRHSRARSVIPRSPPSSRAPSVILRAPLRHSLRPLRHSCAPPPSFPRPPPSFLRPPPSFLRRQESGRTRCVRKRRRCWTASRRSERPLRHSCARSVIPAQAGIQASRLGSRTAPMLDGLPQVRAPPPSFLRPLRHSCAGRNPGELRRFENGADAGRPPAGPSAPSVSSRLGSPDPGRPSVSPSARSVIPVNAQAGIQASRLGSRTAPILDGLPQVRVVPAPAPSFLRQGQLGRERRRCWTASRRSERPLRRLGGPSAGWRLRADLGGRLDSCLRRNDGGGCRNDGRGRTG